MSERSIIETKIKRKEVEVQTLERKLDAAKVYLQALKDIQRAVEKENPDAAEDNTPLRKGSMAAQARDAIMEAGIPVHIDDLLRRLGKDLTRETKASLTGSLAAYVRRHEVFTRPAPNTYGLIELEHFEVEEPENEPPSGFGSPNNCESDDDVPF
ncbi:MAG: hypothetical protein GY791_03840 [Alphaproteobacteria bacterium]|nr:hypothetical protein [Alphaproteobacteria bacterium]